MNRSSAWTSLGPSRSRQVLLCVFLGAAARIVYWATYPVLWKNAAAFYVLDHPVSLVEYVTDFTGYIPVRMPFYDVFAALSYVLFSPVFGLSGIALLTVVLSVAVIAPLYVLVENYYSQRAAFFTSLVFAMHPKLVALSARGFPEGASLSFLVLSLYGLYRAERGGSTGWYVTSGVLVLLAYLMYMPSVGAGLVVSGYLLIKGTVRSRSLDGLTEFVAFSIPPGVVGVLYLVYGPLGESTAILTEGGHASAQPFFVAPESLSFVERAGRYLVYSYADYWWHWIGLDIERQFLIQLESLGQLFGPVFAIYAVGWLLLTFVLSIPIVYGAKYMLQRRRPFDYLIVAIGAFYLAVYANRNWGLMGPIDVTQPMPVYLPSLFAFGVGVDRIADVVGPNRIPRSMTSIVSRDTLVRSLVISGFVVLVANGAIHGVYYDQNVTIAEKDPARELVQVVEEDEDVAVLRPSNYYSTILYSEGDIFPAVIVAPDERGGSIFLDEHVDIHVLGPKEFSEAPPSDYLYISSSCGGLSQRNQSYLTEAKSAGGEVVVEDHIDRGARCDVDVIVVRL